MRPIPRSPKPPLTYAGGRPSSDDLVETLLAGHTLLAESPDHLSQVVDVL